MRYRPPFLFLLLTALCASASWAQSDHPRLVDVASTQCTNCHEDLLQDRDTVHPVTDDCESCHEVEIGESGTRVGLTEPEPALCVSCHDDLGKAAEADLEFSHAPVADSCVVCHDPHASTTPRLLVSPVEELCAECHDASELLDAHSGQLTEKTNCLQCHLPHGSPNAHLVTGSKLHPPFADGDCDSCHRPPFDDRVRLRARGERLCTACHGDILKTVEDGGSLHPAVRAKRPSRGCIACHNPHMSSNDFLLVSEGPDLCRECHENVVKAALAETGHYAAAEDCSSCHSPHRADQPKLLLEPLPSLCHTCHDPEDADLTTAHLGADVGTLDCTSCHTPHGSDNPKLLARTLHPVVEDCDTCHEGSAGELMEDGGSALCLYCHDDIGEVATQAPVPHAALELGDCKDCHNPHASAQDHLVKAPQGAACAECHDDQTASNGEFTHGAIDLIGCRACHEPHGGDNPKLLRKTGNDLCLACHEARNLRVEEGAGTFLVLGRFELPEELVGRLAKLRLSGDGQHGHPVAGHRVIGLPTQEELEGIETTFEGELGCLTCHDPHKGATRQLLAGSETDPMGACVSCHPK